MDPKELMLYYISKGCTFFLMIPGEFSDNLETPIVVPLVVK